MADTTKKPPVVPGYLKISKVIVWLLYAWTILGITVLSIRVFLLAASANAGSGFVDFIYRTSGDYLEPFRGMFPGRPFGETGYLDVSALFAIVMYLLFAWGFSSLIGYIQSKIDQNLLAERDRQKRLEREKDREAMKATRQVRSTK